MPFVQNLNFTTSQHLKGWLDFIGEKEVQRSCAWKWNWSGVIRSFGETREWRGPYGVCMFWGITAERKGLFPPHWSTCRFLEWAEVERRQPVRHVSSLSLFNIQNSLNVGTFSLYNCLLIVTVEHGDTPVIALESRVKLHRASQWNARARKRAREEIC